MARKKQEFDPLAGPIGGGGLRKKKSKGKSFDVLGGGFGGEHPVEKESFDRYAEASFSGSSSDALMETGGGSSPRSKPKKKGLFASIFGGSRKKRTPEQPRENMPLEAESEERPASYVPKHVRDPDLEIQDGVMETGIVDRMDSAYDHGMPEYEEHCDEPALQPHRHYAPEQDEDLFEGEDEVVTPPVRRPLERRPAPASPDLHVCHLCGAASPAELPRFDMGSGESVPLCRTCYRAVTTLVQFRDPADEREIKAEWYTLCPNLDSDRADAVIAGARQNS